MKEKNQANQRVLFSCDIDTYLEYQAVNKRLKEKGYQPYESFRKYLKQIGLPDNPEPYQPNFIKRYKDDSKNGNIIFRVDNGQYLRINRVPVHEKDHDYHYFITGDKGERFANFNLLVFQTFETDALFKPAESLFEITKGQQIPLDENHGLQVTRTNFGYNLIIWDRFRQKKLKIRIGSKKTAPAYSAIHDFYEELTRARDKELDSNAMRLILKIDK